MSGVGGNTILANAGNTAGGLCGRYEHLAPFYRAHSIVEITQEHFHHGNTSPSNPFPY